MFFTSNIENLYHFGNCNFSREGVIKKCLWCNFKENDKIVEWIGIIEEKYGTFISPKGAIHTIRFPFPVEKVFALQPNIGLILSTKFEGHEFAKRLSVCTFYDFLRQNCNILAFFGNFCFSSDFHFCH